jgi:glucose/arabinose dehydrogenase
MFTRDHLVAAPVIVVLHVCAAQAVAAELTASPGFAVSVFHDGVGAVARHLVVRNNGDVLIARRDGVLVALRDGDGDGRADRVEERELPITTGLAVHDGHLYFSDTTSVSRVMLDDALMPQGDAETVVSGFPEQRSHASKTLAFDRQGNLYVNVGAPSNACQREARTPGSPGQRPCPQLERQAAIWRFPAGATGLEQTDGERYVTGTRNVLAMDWNPAADALFFTIHGRDQLSSLWPQLFDAHDNAEMPAEEFHRAEPGADYGWPYTFFDPRTGRRLVAPEYGGNGEQEAEAGRYRPPLHAFPGHWAPNDMVFYWGDQFPERYRGGAFIAWHGSWNRAPLPQEGYRVTFLPFADGAPAGPPEDFLTGFQAGEQVTDPDRASYRPMGLGIGPDGSLYLTETQAGRVWRVVYRS